LCVDPAKVWTTGESNGGQYSWELATNARTAPIFSGILPSIGSQMHGYRLPPLRTTNLTVVGVWGIIDNIMPPIGTGATNAGEGTDPRTVVDLLWGYFYEAARETTSNFAKHLGCSERLPVPVNLTTDESITCQAWLDCNEGCKVIECFSYSGHWTPTAAATLQIDSVHTPRVEWPPPPTGLDKVYFEVQRAVMYMLKIKMAHIGNRIQAGILSAAVSLVQRGIAFVEFLRGLPEALKLFLVAESQSE